MNRPMNRIARWTLVARGRRRGCGAGRHPGGTGGTCRAPPITARRCCPNAPASCRGARSREVTPVKQGARMVNEFSPAILTLDKRDVKVQGFMIPLDMGDKQKRFLLSAVPPHCAFCMPAGPDAVVEIVARTPVKFGFEPIVVSGKFAVLKDDANGVLYRLTDAVYAGAAVPAAAEPK